jgi:hypothetical protein
MNGLEQLKQMWEGLDAEKQKALIGVLVGHALLVLLGFRNLSRTPDERLRGPRWLWKLLMPSSTLKIDDDNIIFAPTGVIAYFLVGKRWGKQQAAEE